MRILHEEIEEPRQVVVRLNNKMTDERIKIQTGFPSLIALLGFIAVVCDGDIDEITSSSSNLTWFEEWFLFMEVIYGKTVPRWSDVSIKYDASDRTLRKIFIKKLNKVLSVRERWPRYATYNEDKTYRKEKNGMRTKINALLCLTIQT
jgi:hypothetical protein